MDLQNLVWILKALAPLISFFGALVGFCSAGITLYVKYKEAGKMLDENRKIEKKKAALDVKKSAAFGATTSKKLKRFEGTKL